jgi:predicted transcriptional regulator
MSATKKEKFSTQIDERVLESLRKLADAEGRQVQFLVEEALRDLLEKRKVQKPRNHVMAAYLESHDAYKSLYERLAK